MSELLSPVSEARKTLELYGADDIPVDVESICKRLGIKVLYVDFSEIEMRVGKEIAGAIQKVGSAYTILVNEDDSDVRARFTIAHELGHYFLHMKGNQKEIVTSFRRDRSPKETSANKFAAELLMPREMVRREYAKMVIPVSDSLAKKFEVSKSAMRVRLDSLGLNYV